MKNYAGNKFIVDYSTDHLYLFFLGNDYHFDLNEGDAGDYWTSFEYEGKGYGRESVEAVLRWGFEECGISTILAIVLPQNQGSVRLLEQLGMRLQTTITKPETGDELLLYSISAST
jgi:RimJ/RimL family protein N-acetyltransferase